MEREFWTSKNGINSTPYELVELVQGIKQLAIVVKFNQEDQDLFGLYRPEQGIKISIDPRIPKPKELYLDCAFSELCQSLGWDHVAPVFEWTLNEKDKGVIRPYWKEVQQYQVYNFKRESLLKQNSTLWKTIAVGDYIFGVGDRVANDFLQTSEGLKLVDSGLSFLSGLDFQYQQSIIRDNLKGESISDQPELLNSICMIPTIVQVNQHLTNENIHWVIKRVENILKQQIII